jgi:hypothetical protein
VFLFVLFAKKLLYLDRGPSYEANRGCGRRPLHSPYSGEPQIHSGLHGSEHHSQETGKT